MPARRKQPREKAPEIGAIRYTVVFRAAGGSTGMWNGPSSHMLMTLEGAKAELLEAAAYDSDEYFVCELVPRFRAKRPADITIEPV